MTKYFKYIKWFFRTIAILVLVFVFLIFSVYIPIVQDYVISKIENRLSQETQATVSIEDFDLSFFANVNLNNVIINRESDTLLILDHLLLDIEFSPLINHKIIIDEIVIEGLYTDIYRLMEQDSINSIDNEPQQKEESNWEIIFNSISIINSNIIYSDTNARSDLILNIGSIELSEFAMDSFVSHAKYAKLIDTKISYIAPFFADEEIDTSIIDFIISIEEAEMLNFQFYYNDSLMSFETGGEKIFASNLYANIADEVTNFSSVKFDNSYFNFRYINDTLITPESDIDWKVYCELIDVKNSKFTYDIPYMSMDTNVFDYNHIRLTDIDGAAERVFYSYHEMWGDINELSFIENEKINVSSMSGEYFANDTLLRLDNVEISTPENRIKADGSTGFYVYDFSFTDTEKINLALSFEINNWSELNFFSGGQLEGIEGIDRFNNKYINLTTQITGKMDTLYSHIDLTFNKTHLISQGYVLNLVNPETLNYDFSITELMLPKQDITLFMNDNTLEFVPQHTQINGKVKGTINKTSFSANIKSDYGRQSVRMMLDLSDSLPSISTEIYGNIAIGAFHNLEADSIEIISEIKGDELANMVANADIVLKNAKIDTLEYEGISMHIILDKTNYEIELVSTDDKVRFNLNSQGIINDSIINSNTKLLVNNIDFNKNGILKSPMNVRLQSQISLQFNFNNYFTELNADIWDIATTDSIETNYIEKLDIDFIYNNEYSKFDLYSDNNTINAAIHGSLDTLINNIEQFVEILVLKDESNHDSLFLPSFNLNADLNDPYDIFGDHISKDWPQFSDFMLNMAYDNTKWNSININMLLLDFEYSNNRLDSTSISIVGGRKELNYQLKSSIFLDSMINTNIYIDGYYNHGKLFTHLNLSDDNKADFLNIKLSSQKADLGYSIKIHDDSLILLSYDWAIEKDNNLIIQEDKIIASNLILNRENKEIILKTDTLLNEIELMLNNIDLAVFNSIMNKDSMLAGIVNINLIASYDSELPNLNLNANIDSFKYDNYPIGDISIRECLIDTSHFTFNFGVNRNKETIDIKGIVNYKDEKEIRIESKTSDFNLGVLNKLLDEYLYDVAGAVNSEFIITGTAEKPLINGYLEFNKASFGLIALQEVYTVNNEKVLFKDNTMSADRINIFDRNKHKLAFSGDIQYKDNEIFFNDFSLNSDVIELMNSEREHEELIYGLIKAKLEVHLNGSMNNLQAKSKTILNYPTQINYIFPEDLSLESNNGIINFTKIDTLNIIDSLLVSEVVPSSTFDFFNTLDAELVVKDGCKFNIYFDNSMENFLNVAVNGDIKYVINNKTAKTYGLLNIDKGNMSYSIPMVTMDKLKIEDGSYIQITNDLDNPLLNINTSTKIWAQTGGLVEDYNRNLEITVFMFAKGSLDNLIIQFDISSETTDPLISSKILQMTDKERSINAVNLLMRGQFATLQNTKTIDVNAYISQMLASGLNRLVSDRVKFVDMSFDMKSYNNYTSSGSLESQSDLFFNVGKSFYHDRFRIKYTGSLTTNTTQQGQNYGQMESVTQSNLSIEYDINKSGSLQALLFRKSAYDDIMEGKIISTGGGFRIKKTYSSFSDIFMFEKEQ